MNKYESLWLWIKDNKDVDFILSFDEIEEILSFPIDHAFLACKKQLEEYGFKVGKISMKEKKVNFIKL